jgi:hypothetical protein
VSDDEVSVVGVLPVGQGGFRAEGAGLGPAIKYTLKVGDTDLTIIGKWLRDVHSENRLEYSNATLSFAFRL